MQDQLLSRLRHNQRCLVEELLKRNIQITLLDRTFELLEARFGEHVELLVDIDSSLMPFVASTVTNNKYLAKQLLAAAGLSTTRGEEFPSTAIAEAFEYFDELGGPAVLKPSVGTGGDEVHLNLESREEVGKAVKSIVKALGPVDFLLEEQFPGKEYRIFLTRKGEYAALYREPAYVVGDGKRTLLELARAETMRRKDPAVICLAPIIMDGIAEFFLKKQGLAFNHVPKAGAKIYVRQNSNVGTGGVCHDFTDKIHPGILSICRKALALFPRLPYAGMDFICADGAAEQTSDSYRILEVNPLPSLGIHITPAEGEGRNVAAMVADLIFPETAGG